MKVKNISYLFLLLSFIWSCKKCPTADMLQGGWTEMNNSSDKSKLVFQGDILYFYHSTNIDTFSYTLDRKHCSLSLVLLYNPANVSSKMCDMEYHKRKNIINVWGLFPPTTGMESVTNYKRD